jgi:hypothetical protein
MKGLSELTRIEKLIENQGDLAQIKVLDTVKAFNKEFPIYGITIGTQDKTKPTFGLFGGVHGLEKIGTQCVTAYLESLFEQLRWDEDLRNRFKNVRLVSIPLVNPAGMYANTRSNPRGVDLMRNSPVEAPDKPLFLVGGHRYSSKLPYFRGHANTEMEIESQALCDFVEEQMFESESALAVDVHSGFGVIDRLWYPFARSREPFPRQKEVESLGNLLSKSYPNHVYQIEPQSLTYTTHGDLWDHLFDKHYSIHGNVGPLFIPWTLEMGSWMWVRKNPLQLFSAFGRFNPIKIHRYRRILRRHIPLFDFLVRAVKNYRTWIK